MNERGTSRILIFDSGVGGLSVAARVHEHLPGVSIVYLADNAAFPYGDQPESVVIERCCMLIGQALECYPCDAVVVACNTASTVALPHLRALTMVPVIGVVPAVKPAASQTVNRRIGVLATPATVSRPYLDELINEFAAGCQVERLGHPGLVEWAEALVRGEPVPQGELDEVVASLASAGVDTVVLGCTHYPLILDNLKRSLPGVRFWVDSGDAIARRVAWILSQAGKTSVPDDHFGESSFRPVTAVLFSGSVPSGVASYMSGMGLQPLEVIGHWPGHS